jgi:hypothetical protein
MVNGSCHSSALHCFAYPPCMTLILLRGFAGFPRAAHRAADVQHEIPDLFDFGIAGGIAAVLIPDFRCFGILGTL